MVILWKKIIEPVRFRKSPPTALWRECIFFTGEDKMKTKVIAIANEKGGVAKTTTAINLAYELQQRRRKVLLIDNDPQSNLTRHCGSDPYGDDHTPLTKLVQNMINYISGYKMTNEEMLPPAEEVIIQKNGFEYIAASVDLEVAERALCVTSNTEHILDEMVKEYGKGYDYVLIDCRPTLSTLTLNAFVAADSVIIPIESEPYAVDGLSTILRNINIIRDGVLGHTGLNPKLSIEGILFTMHKGRLRLTQDLEAQVKGKFGESLKVFQTMIPASVKAPESVIAKSAVRAYDRKNPVGIAYQHLAEEIDSNY